MGSTKEQAVNIGDDLIDGMERRPNENMTQDEHYYRNRLNIEYQWDKFEKLNDRLPDTLKWRELGPIASMHHKFSIEYTLQGNNRKYVSACEHFEMVFTKENYLVDEKFNSVYMGTYNYYGPTQWDKHFNYDMFPYYKYRNVVR